MGIGAILVGIAAGVVTLAAVLRPLVRSERPADSRSASESDAVDQLIEHWVARVRAERPMGMPVSSAPICDRCGYPLRTGDNFCSRCGAPVRGEG